MYSGRSTLFREKYIMRFPEIKLRTELSVFFALVLVIIASLLLNLVEAARTQGARTYLTMAADSAIDSLFSQYHRLLWNDYRMLGLEMYSQKEITDEFDGFIKPYFCETENRYALEASGNTEILSYELLTDANGAVLRREIVDYMKYGLAFSVMELSDMLEFREILKDGMSCSQVSDEFAGCSMEAEKLEGILKKLSEKVREHNNAADSAWQSVTVYDGRSFLTAASELSALLDGITREALLFSQAASELSAAVAEAEAGFEERFSGGELSRSSYETLKSELSEFRKYADERGEVRILVEELKEISAFDLSVLENTEDRVHEAIEYLDNFVPERVIVGYREPLKEGEEPVPVYEESEPDEAAAYLQAISCFDSYRRMEMPAQAGTPDKEKENQLNSVKALLSEGMLSLILPDNYKTPGVPLDLEERPSAVYPGEKQETDDETVLSDRIFLTEYILQLLDSYGRDGNRESHLEAEYVMFGKETDSENLSGMISETVAIRTGLNLLYLLRDTGKREAASKLSLAVTGLAAATPLSTVVFFLILTTWALGQAVLDARDLLHGEKVPVMHTDKSFYLSLEGLLSDFTGIFGSPHSSSEGLDYKDYLRLLLFLHMNTESEYRILDVIQMNIRKVQPDFLADRLYTGIHLETGAFSSHVFMNGNRKKYTIRVKTYESY